MSADLEVVSLHDHGERVVVGEGEDRQLARLVSAVVAMPQDGERPRYVLATAARTDDGRVVESPMDPVIPPRVRWALVEAGADPLRVEEQILAAIAARIGKELEP